MARTGVRRYRWRGSGGGPVASAVFKTVARPHERSRVGSTPMHSRQGIESGVSVYEARALCTTSTGSPGSIPDGFRPIPVACR